MEEQSKQDWERIFGLFKLEYEQAAERYENIYKAIWQIFSYMSILAAGILTFGSRRSSLPIQVTAFIALIPLVFWFLAIYIPMNRYGEDQGKHLADMENGINDITKDFKNPCWQLKHYKIFDARKKKLDSAKINSTPQEENVDCLKEKFPWGVTYAVWVFGVVVCLLWIILLFVAIPYFNNLFQLQERSSEQIELKLESVQVSIQDPQLQKLQNKLDSLSQQINSIESLILDIKANSNQQ